MPQRSFVLVFHLLRCLSIESSPYGIAMVAYSQHISR